MARSLRGELLVWILLPLAIVVGFNVWTDHTGAVSTADLITDRTLLASARVIAEQIKDNDGSVEALIPPSALEMFASDDHDRVIYRVLAPTGELIAGYPDVAGPPAPPHDLEPVFFATRFRVEDIRAVAIAQPVVSKLADGRALVIVGTTLRGHDRLVADLWRSSILNQLVLVGLAALLALYGLRRGLAPLQGLRREVAARHPRSIGKIETARVQREVRPLVEALNDAFDRMQGFISMQRRFVANASHQMRTPLAVLKIQSTVGLRETDIAAKNEALEAIDHGLDAVSRLVNQLLTLARAEPGSASLRKERVDFVAIAREALEGLAPLALDREIDLTLDAPDAPLAMQGHSTLLREIVANLVENALRYTPCGGAIAVAIQRELGQIVLSVADSGPGIAEAERAQVFERFYRLPGSKGDGSGLGLAIVKEIVIAHDGDVILTDAVSGTGLRVTVTLPTTTA